MKKIKFTCPNCQAKLRVPTHLAGVTAPCPKCGAEIMAPTDFENFIEGEPRRVSRAKKPAAAAVPLPQKPVADFDYPTGEIIEESRLINAPESESVIAPDPMQSAVLPDPLASPVNAIDAKTTAPVPVPRPPKAPVFTGGMVAPPAPVIPDDLSAAIQHDVITAIPPERVAEEPPAVAKTQPIKINPQPSSLLPVGEADTSLPGELPRLDTALAGQGKNEAETLTPEEEPEPTKLVLPMPGDVTEHYTPGDFIVPTHTPNEGLAEIQKEINESPDFSELEDPVEAIEPINPVTPAPLAAEEELAPESATEFPAPIGEVVAPLDEVIEEPVETVEPLVEEMSEVPEPVIHDELAISIDELEISEEEPSISMDELEITEPLKPIDLPGSEPETVFADDKIHEFGFEPREPETAPLEPAPKDLTTELGFEPAVEDGMDEVPAVDGDTESGDDFDQFLSGVDSSGVGSSDVKATLDLNELPSNDGDAGDPIHDIFAEPGEEEQQELPKPRKPLIPSKTPKVPEAELPEPEGDTEKIAATNELDEIFGAGSDIGKSGGPSRTTVVMLSTLGAAAIIAVVAMVLIINALGGIDVATPEPDVESPPPAIANGPEPLASSNLGMTPGIDSPSGSVPTSIKPPAPPTIATESLEPPATTENPVATVPPAPSVENPPVEPTPVNNATGDATAAGEEGDAPAMSFDERVLSIVNGDSSPEGVGNAGPTSLSPMEMVNSAASEFVTAVGDNAPGVTPLVRAPEDQSPTSIAEEAASPASMSVSNYNPEASFPAPTSPDDLLGRTHDLLDAYLRAPDWETRMKYVYRGDSLRPSVEEYYQKWPFKQFATFSKALFQMEPSKENGGPYWVYMISSSENDPGFPVIIREEDGLLKVDWEVFSEFQDERFVKFLAGDIPSPHTLRVVINRVSDYYGLDRDGFTDLDDYFVYQVKPPYGGLNEFSTYAFVKKESPIAARFEEVVPLNEDPLAVIITMEEKPFPHGINHYVITDYITEGWFR